MLHKKKSSQTLFFPIGSSPLADAGDVQPPVPLRRPNDMQIGRRLSPCKVPKLDSI